MRSYDVYRLEDLEGSIVHSSKSTVHSPYSTVHIRCQGHRLAGLVVGSWAPSHYTGRVLLARNVQSEAIKALGHPALSDSFVSFAKTVMGLGVDKVKDGEDLRLSFNGTSYNAAMHKAAMSLGTLFPSPGLEAALQHLELEFGREVVNNDYSKLSRLIAVTKQSTVQSPDSMSTSTLADKVSWLVEMLSDMG